jgi:hypothetical protein
MNQRVLNSGQFGGATAINSGTAVPYLDSASGADAAVARPKPLWPMLVLAGGGLLTLAWDGFLLWEFIRLIALWVGSDLS